MTDTAAPCSIFRPIQIIEGAFCVPAYQRGYRWTQRDVEFLLDDIGTSCEKNSNADYVLQPVVVRQLHPGTGQSGLHWELIDGQQRLTTIYLIFRVLADLGWGSTPPYSLQYDTRETWDDFQHVLDKRDYNIDFYHLARAHDCVKAWFTKASAVERKARATRFLAYLNERVKVIWYEPFALQLNASHAKKQEAEAIALFTRLNVGRIALTDAELVKAQLLTALKNESKNTGERPLAPGIVAAEWDSIERDLQRPDVWAFIASSCDHEGTPSYATRIGLLLDVLADEQPKDPSPGPWPCGQRPRYHTFSTLRQSIADKPEQFWRKLTALHAQVMGWFDNYAWHNAIGFLIASRSRTLADIVSQAKERSKTAFRETIEGEIRKAINITESQLQDLSYETKTHREKLSNILLLFNIETSTRGQQHFPFWAHGPKQWSLEHIHAQQSAGLATDAARITWLKQHLAALEAFSLFKLTSPRIGLEEKQNALINNIKNAVRQSELGTSATPTSDRLTHDTFKTLQEAVFEFFSNDHVPDHSIANLALLSQSDNSALSNAVFAVKRQKIIEADKAGKYIPACTRYVFLKYYAKPGNEQWHFWGPADRKCYMDAIKDTTIGIGRYLKHDIVK